MSRPKADRAEISFNLPDIGRCAYREIEGNVSPKLRAAIDAAYDAFNRVYEEFGAVQTVAAPEADRWEWQAAYDYNSPYEGEWSLRNYHASTQEEAEEWCLDRVSKPERYRDVRIERRHPATPAGPWTRRGEGGWPC